MRYWVLCSGAPLGMVELTEAAIAAGRLAPAPGYAAIRETVRAASEALLALGFYGGAAPALDADGAHAQTALAAAAALPLELLDGTGASVAATFVNLIESPTDGGVVVVAGLGESLVRVRAGRSLLPTEERGLGSPAV